MDLFDTEVDVEREVSGVWKKIDDETELLIARANNRAFNEEKERLLRAHEGKEMTEEEKDKLFGRCIAKATLLGWKGLKHKGELIEYSKEKCEEIILNPRFKEFRARVFVLSTEVENFYAKNLEEKLGN